MSDETRPEPPELGGAEPIDTLGAHERDRALEREHERPELPAAKTFAAAGAGRVMRVAGVVGLVGAALTALGFVLDADRTLASWLVAWIACVAAAVGALAMLLISYAVNGRWPAVVRRMLEAIPASLVPLVALAVPLVVGAPRLWSWIDPSPGLAREIAPRAGWLAPLPVALRSIGYLAVWIVLAELFRRWSTRRDASPPRQAKLGRDALDRERRAASGWIGPVFLVLTFASFDWVMSLDPTWYSSAFGLYVITGALASGLSVAILIAARQTAVPLRAPHFHALGRVLLAFVALWGYIGYFQAFLIQIADLPDEVTFYVTRMDGAMKPLTFALVALHLVLPFVLLLARQAKHRPRYLAGVAVLLLIAHVVDVWWLVVPSAAPGRLPSWTDVTALAAVGGLAVAATAWRVRGMSIVPVGDPYFESGLAYRSDH